MTSYLHFRVNPGGCGKRSNKTLFYSTHTLTSSLKSHRPHGNSTNLLVIRLIFFGASNSTADFSAANSDFPCSAYISTGPFMGCCRIGATSDISSVSGCTRRLFRLKINTPAANSTTATTTTTAIPISAPTLSLVLAWFLLDGKDAEEEGVTRRVNVTVAPPLVADVVPTV